MIDNLFLLAIGAFGWGLALATYRLFARRNGWPMGALHADLPVVPIAIGILALLAGLLFAAARGAAYGGLVIVICGIGLAVFWIGFLRVASQISLFLAPISAVLLVFGWLAVPLGYGRADWAYKHPSDYLGPRDRDAEVRDDDAADARTPGRR